MAYLAVCDVLHLYPVPHFSNKNNNGAEHE
jgi:hypothetical protein